jgi:hypothetical protein
MDQSIEQRLKTLEWLRGDLPAFASECLRIRPKDAMNTPIIPLKFNRTQLFIHERIEEQKTRTGKVRVILGKGRQTTVSTYIAGRFYHKTTFFRGVHTYILTHEQDATDNLFEMVERFQEYNPLRPSTGVDNAKELTFDRLGSSYEVGTAGTKAGGRSQTIQLLHWSEVAFSPNAKGHFAGIVQTVPDLSGTEIVLESTGNGPSGAYYDHWQDAERGIGDYMALFVPWFWTQEYSRQIDPDWVASDEERFYQNAYQLTDGQMAWRRAKIVELKDPKLFKQEYPASAVEMFEATGKQSYIDPETVLAARKSNKEGFGPLVIGVDPSRFGDDRFSIAWRQGRKVSKVESRTKLGTTEALTWLRDIIDRDKPDRMFIDAGGGGDRLYDILESWGEPYSKVIKLVNFGGKPLTGQQMMRDGTRRPGPVDRRAEMYMRSKDWLEQPSGADIPDSDSLQSDACAATYTYQTTDQKLRLESKEEMRRRGVKSPDEWDAVILTFAEPVRESLKRATPAPVESLQVPSGPGTGWLGI